MQAHECTCKRHQGPTNLVNGKSDHKMWDFQQGVDQAEWIIVHQLPQNNSNSTTKSAGTNSNPKGTDRAKQ